MKDEKQKQWECELDYAIENNKTFVVTGEMVQHEMLRLQKENARLKEFGSREEEENERTK